MPRKNRKAADVREALLEAGLELLAERSGGTRLRITLTDAIERAGVPRSSAYASLAGPDGTPRDRFYRELLARLETSVAPSATLAEIDQVLSDHAEDLASEDPDRWAFVLRELIRRAVGLNVHEIAERRNWRQLAASAIAFGSGEEGLTDEATRQLADVRDTGPFLDGYEAILALFGLRATPTVDLDTFSVTALHVVDAIALRITLDKRLDNIERPTGPDGELRIWNAGSIAFEGLVLACVEPDPEATTSANLATWRRSG